MIGVIATLILLGAGRGIAAQEVPLPTDSDVDSTRIRILRSLGRVTTAPISRELIQEGDSAVLAGLGREGEEEGLRPVVRGGGGADTSAGDSVLAALLSLEGYTRTRYEGERAEFETKEGRLILLSPAGVRARGGSSSDSLFAADSLAADSPAADSLAADSLRGGGEPGVSPDSAIAGGDDEERETGSPARLLFDGREIVADTAIRYDERSGRVSTVGNTVTTDPGSAPMESRTLIYSLEEGRGTALGARTTYQDGAGEWHLVGDANAIYQGEAWLHDAIFTSCDLPFPHTHSHFKVNEIKVVAGNILVARPVTLYFADVPVAWLPFIAQSLSTGRASGLLTPQFSVNDIVRTSGGYARRISNLGFYWAMSEYSDASLAMGWFSGNYVDLTGTLRYGWARKFLSGSIAYRQYWQDDGGRNLAFDTQHSWQMNERTKVNISARYSSSADFVRRNSFDPREIVQSINSNGGINRRFDWGNLSMTASRSQYLNDGRVEQTLPQLSLSLQPITFFSAPEGRARAWNNITWNGSGTFRRDLTERPEQRPDSFQIGRADRAGVTANWRSSLSMGALSFNQGFELREEVALAVPVGFGAPVYPGAAQDGVRDRGRRALGWNASLGYQQRLIGSTTLTPSIRVEGQAVQDDTLHMARDRYVQGPARVAFGAELRTDLYGFFPGIGRFDAIRHKVSTSFSYSYSPAVTPTPVQSMVFGAREALAQNRITIGLNQTFEARVAPGEESDPQPEPVPVEARLEWDPVTGEPLPPPDSLLTADSIAVADSLRMLELSGGGVNAPTRMERREVVKLLGLNTSAMVYDFVLADSLGGIWGIQTARISNQVTSDYLRGLTLTLEHDLFEDRQGMGGPGTDGVEPTRSFSPMLSRASFNFSIGSSSGIFRRLGLFQGDGGADREPMAADGHEQGEGGIVPGLGEGGRPVRTPSFTGAPGAWNANFSYSLTRNRPGSGGFSGQTQQMLGIQASFRPTPAWDVRWSTAYDIERAAFNDHSVQLTRDLHEWEATFGFQQTVSGNWSFIFNVSLVANRDLKFDYRQRSSVSGQDSPFPPGF